MAPFGPKWPLDVEVKLPKLKPVGPKWPLNVGHGAPTRERVPLGKRIRALAGTRAGRRVVNWGLRASLLEFRVLLYAGLCIFVFGFWLERQKLVADIDGTIFQQSQLASEATLQAQRYYDDIRPEPAKTVFIDLTPEKPPKHLDPGEKKDFKDVFKTLKDKGDLKNLDPNGQFNGQYINHIKLHYDQQTSRAPRQTHTSMHEVRYNMREHQEGPAAKGGVNKVQKVKMASGRTTKLRGPSHTTVQQFQGTSGRGKKGRGM